MSSYWIVRGDLGQALSLAGASLEHAERTLNRKRMAWAHKLSGEIATLEDRPEDARREFEAAFQILGHGACPTIEWQILRAAAVAADARGDDAAQGELMGHARAIVYTLADSVRDDGLRRQFLDAKPIRELFS